MGIPNGKGPKGPERSDFVFPEPLVRMRSPVRIWLAAPKETRGGKLLRVFCFSGQGLATSSHPRSGDSIGGREGSRKAKLCGRPVASPNLASSSKRSRKSYDFRDLCCLFEGKGTGFRWGRTADPRPDPQADRSGRAQKGPKRKQRMGGGADPRGEQQLSFPICLRPLCEKDFFFVYRGANSEQR